MSGYDSEVVQAGVVPGSHGRPAGTMLAALYGELTSHPWRDPELTQDVYFLFHDRSLAMGWLSDVGKLGESRTDESTGHVQEREVADVGSVGLWGMNDAGPDHLGSGPTSSPLAWFQVGIDDVPADRPLPVQPFLRCAGDVVARFGILGLQAVQVLLPVQNLDASPRTVAVVPSLRTTGWFAHCDPQSRTRVRVTLDTGQDPSILSAAPEMLTWMQQLEQDTFLCDSYSSADHDPLSVKPPFGDHVWRGPPLNRASFHGTLAEWSLDALGWLAAFLADGGARFGVMTPLLLTASRPKGASHAFD